jgi:hypothetical protein
MLHGLFHCFVCVCVCVCVCVRRDVIHIGGEYRLVGCGRQICASS